MDDASKKQVSQIKMDDFMKKLGEKNGKKSFLFVASCVLTHDLALFEGKNQQDSQEFLNFILNEINDKILQDNKWDASHISPQRRVEKVSLVLAYFCAGIGFQDSILCKNGNFENSEKF